MIIKVGNLYGVNSWSEGTKLYKPSENLQKEYDRNPVAVINRLKRQGQLETLEKLQKGVK